jgi:hypothetical protein
MLQSILGRYEYCLVQSLDSFVCDTCYAEVMTSIPVFCKSIPALLCIKRIGESNLEVGALVVMSALREFHKIEGAAIEALYSAALNVRH